MESRRSRPSQTIQSSSGIALVAKMVDARDLKSLGKSRAGSIPAERTKLENIVWVVSGVGALEQRNGTIKEYLEYDMVNIPDAP